MMLPKINDMITTEQALELCKHFNLNYLIKRIESDSDKYKPWEFDGCSGLPDEAMGFFTGCEWKNKRLLDKNARIDNKERFMESAGNLFTKYRLYVDKKCSTKTVNADKMQVIKELRLAIGEGDQSNSNKIVRIERYRELSQKMLGYEIPEYDEYAWFEQAVNEKVRGLRDKSDSFLTRWDPLTDIYTWRKPSKYKETNWYKFQEAVKLNQDTTWDLLDNKVFSKLDLKDL